MRSLRFGYWWLAGGVLLVGGVLYSTLTPPRGGLHSFGLDDKFAHFLAFALLMGWFSGVYRPKWLPLIAILLVGLGIGIEFLQGYLTYRSAEVADAMFDFAGILVAWVFVAAGFGGWVEFIEARLPAADT